MTKRAILNEIVVSLNTIITELAKVEGGTVSDKAYLGFARGELESLRRRADHMDTEEVMYENRKNVRPREIPVEDQIF